MKSINYLTVEQCNERYPAVGNSVAKDTVTSKYMHVSTYDYLKYLEADGLRPYQVQGTRCRDVTNKVYAKHAVFLTNPDWIKEGCEYFPTVVMLNAHDGSSSVTFMIGVYRIVCSNGLVIGSSLSKPIRVRHLHANRERLHAVYNQLVAQITILDRAISNMRSTPVSLEAEHAFIDSAVQLRWGDKVPQNKKFDSNSLNMAHRLEDTTPNVWTLYNRVQENILNKGRGYRRVASIDKNIKINQGLWDAALKLAA